MCVTHNAISPKDDNDKKQKSRKNASNTYSAVYNGCNQAEAFAKHITTLLTNPDSQVSLIVDKAPVRVNI